MLRYNVCIQMLYSLQWEIPSYTEVIQLGLLYPDLSNNSQHDAFGSHAHDDINADFLLGVCGGRLQTGGSVPQTGQPDWEVWRSSVCSQPRML